MKRTYQPSKTVRKRRHGFRARMKTEGGQAVLNNRRKQGRKRLTVSSSMQLIRLETLKKRDDFLNTAKSGLKRPVKSLVLQANPNELGKIRVGYTVTKYTSKLAVERNKIKRRLRAAVREVFPEHAKPSHDYVIIGKMDCLRKDFEELKNDLKYTLRKIFENTH